VIAHLRGRLLRKEPGEVVIDVGGVGYRVAIPVSTFYRLGEAGSEASLLTHTHVREDALALYGFLSAEEQSLFELLIAISGVGPKLAIGILSGIETPDLVLALRTSDIARLTRIPGVGKKTAERLVVELKEKAAKLSVGDAAPTSPPESSTQEDLTSALVHLGYSRPEAEKAVERALRDGGERKFEELLRHALRSIAGR